MSEDDEIVQAFLEESRENLDQLDLDLVELEANPADPALLARVFRAVHTIKGTCGFLGYGRLEALTHAGENLLAALRQGDLRLGPEITTSLLRLLDSTRAVLARIEATGAEGEDDHSAVIAEMYGHLKAAAPAPAVSPPDAVTADGAASSSVAPESSLRVDVAVLDKLLNLVGELVLTRSQIGELASEDEEGPIFLLSRQLRLITAELQEGVMQARLQPVGTVTGKLRRIARDVAAALDKRVVVDLEGESIGVDRAVNEALRDPLLHLVRNAIDHGIEPPSDRVAVGKPAEGRLRIRAFHEGGRVHVEVADDGRGVDVDRLVSRSVETGVLRAEEASVLSPAEKLELMFHAGVSTRGEVTKMSGRGVGMDVVRTKMEQVGGSIEVFSEPGQGTLFRINIPLTLAIMPAVIIWCGGSRYVVPQVDVEEVLYFDALEAADQLEELGDARIHRLRGRLLPLVELAGHLGVGSPERREVDVVVVRTGGRRFGLVVDAVGDSTEAVVKALPPEIRSIPLFSGVTLLADGRPALILDIDSLASASGIGAGENQEPGAGENQEPGAGAVAGRADPVQAAGILVATGSGGGHLGFPLDVVRRLEQFGPDQVERVGDREVVPYREGILPVIRLSEALPAVATDRPDAASSASSDTLHAVVCSSTRGLVGLVVDRIDDVVAAPAARPEPAGRPGVSGCLVVEGRVTEMIDVEALVADAGMGAGA